MPDFRNYHLLKILDAYELQKLPLDQFLNFYFRSHKAIGSKDRIYIAEMIYGMIRWLGLIDYMLSSRTNWAARLECYQTIKISQLINEETIPQHCRVSFPKHLYDLLYQEYKEKAFNLCIACNQTAPITIRINPQKTTRDELLKRWEAFSIVPTKHSPLGLTFTKKMALFSLPEFKEGLFEMQDEGSQMLASLATIQPGEQILDFCSGSGGKTLAFAHLLKGTGQIYLHDIRKNAIEQARKRLNRAGIQNAQFFCNDSPQLNKLKKKMDWVFVDAPCSGTGTLRRNPDMKWKFNQALLDRLIGQQRIIFEKALSFLKPNGKIIYATCSLLHDENEGQLAHFLNTYPLIQEGQSIKTLPSNGEMDGFFGVVFKKLTIAD